jgi:hypothetical protein
MMNALKVMSDLHPTLFETYARRSKGISNGHTGSGMRDSVRVPTPLSTSTSASSSWTLLEKYAERERARQQARDVTRLVEGVLDPDDLGPSADVTDDDWDDLFGTGEADGAGEQYASSSMVMESIPSVVMELPVTEIRESQGTASSVERGRETKGRTLGPEVKEDMPLDPPLSQGRRMVP